MSLTQDGQTFVGDHGKIMVTRPDSRLQRSFYPGVQGESHIMGAVGARELSTSFTMKGYSTSALLDLAIAAVNQRVSVLKGRLTVTGSFAGVFDKCTFLGFEIEDQGWRPPHQWVARGRLYWIQRDPNTVPEE